MQMPTTILIVDTETTGLSPEEGARLIEVGAILFSVTHRSTICQSSFLLPTEENAAEGINGISPELTQLPAPVSAAMGMLAQMIGCADALVAHNAAFDRPWLESITGPIALPWLCTMDDFDWEGIEGRPSVTKLALAHGVPVWAAHRALTDCTYLAQVFERCDDLKGLLYRALLPKVLYRAQVSYDRRELAKAAGFHWDAGQKAWLRRMAPELATGFPFQITEVPE